MKVCFGHDLKLTIAMRSHHGSLSLQRIVGSSVTKWVKEGSIIYVGAKLEISPFLRS